MTTSATCCALIGFDDIAAAAPAASVMNSRRFIRSPFAVRYLAYHFRTLRRVRNGQRSAQYADKVHVRFVLPAQPVDATQALNLSAGVSNCKV